MKELALTGMGIPPFSIRGVTQTLEVLERDDLRRNMNGTLLDLSNSNFRKFVSEIECEDMTSPAQHDIWRGKILTVDCIVELAVAGTLPDPPEDWEDNIRPIVPGSLRERDGFIFYRPRLTMMVVEPPVVERDEWGGVVGWSMTLGEV